MAPTLTEQNPPLPLEEIKWIADNFGELSRKEQFKVIDRLVGVHPILSIQWGGQMRYRRARRLGPQQIIKNVSELIWRADKVPSVGRANTAEWPVLYLACRRDTALAEVGVEDAQKAIVAEFKIRSSSGIHVAPIGEMSQVSRIGRGRLINGGDNPITKVLNACPRKEALSLLATDEFLAEVLLNRSDDYQLSSRVARAIFVKSPQIQGVAFPSVRHNGGINFAMKTNDFWYNWGLASVTEGTANHIAGGYYLIEPCKNVSGVDNQGNLAWDQRDRVDGSSALLDPLWYPVEFD